jgi:hypothetical protein
MLKGDGKGRGFILSGPGPIDIDGARQLLLQRTPTEGSYQQSLFGKFLVWSLLILGTVAVLKRKFASPP